MEDHAGIVLAGGRSSRMGAPKAALEWHGSTLLRRAGLDPSRVHTASSGSDVIGNGGGGRVEIGVIKR